jgi:capsular exopolysaccharide synthesis family protein
MFTAVEHKRKTLVLTSSGPKEGKTTTAVNLAIVMAQTGEKVLLLDADLRKPRVGKVFDIHEKEGLTEVLAGDRTVDEVLHKTDIKNLSAIVCGAIPPNPSELLGSHKMSELLEKLEKKFDRIIIDTAPVLAVTDAVVLSNKVDGTMVVIKAGETNRNAVLKTKEILKSVQASRLIGVVLNMVDTAKTGSHYYYNYYGKYGDYYGHDEKA